MVNFEEEYKKIGDGKDVEYLKITEGTHKITFNDDGLKDIAHFKNPQTGEDEEKERVTFSDSVNGKDYAWSVFPTQKIPYGPNSLYAQIMTCGKAWGALKGHTMTLIAMGNGMKRRYTVVEASELSKQIKSDGKVEVVESEIKA